MKNFEAKYNKHVYKIIFSYYIIVYVNILLIILNLFNNDHII